MDHLAEGSDCRLACRRLLIVDDDDGIRTHLGGRSAATKRFPYVACAADGTIRAMSNSMPARPRERKNSIIVLLRLMLPGLGGFGCFCAICAAVIPLTPISDGECAWTPKLGQVSWP